MVDNTCFKPIRPLFESLLACISEKFPDATILVEQAFGKVYRHSKSGSTIKDNMFTSYGAVIRYCADTESSNHPETFEFSFIDFSPEYISGIPSKLEEQIRSQGLVLQNQKYKDPSAPKDTFNKSSSYCIDPKSFSDETIMNRLETLHNNALEYDSRIFDCACIYQYLYKHQWFLSSAKDYEQHLLWSNGVIQPLANENGKTRYYYLPFSIVGGAELIEKMNADFSYACQCAIELLHSETITPGTYDVICMPDVTGLIAHEAFGHGVEMDMFVKDRALAKDYINKPVASEIVTMHDNAGTYQECGSYFFDDEGTLSNDTIIIDKGILVRGISDLRSAKRLGTQPTGNGRRESFKRKAYTRMTNTYFEAGNDKLEDMIASIQSGILLENASSGMEDPKNWGIQCMVNIGREIKDGKLTGRIYSPVCLSGYVPDLLSSISMISDELHVCGTGCCGKGYKEWVKVSDGGAAIKAICKLS